MANQRQSRFEKPSSYVDISMLFYVFILIVIGLIMIYSTTVYKSGFDEMRSQLVATGLGIIVMIIASRVNLQKIPYLFPILIFISAGSIFMLLTPLKMTLNNATRWFRLFGMSVQSAEIVKLCLIMMMAQWLTAKRESLKTLKGNIMAWAIPVGYSLLLGVISNNLSSAFIIIAICGVMIVMISPYTKLYMLAGLGGVGLVSLLVLGIKYDLVHLGFRSNRVLVWLNPENPIAGVDNFQTVQALYAIGSGGLMGKGIGEGIQKINKIPEAQNDMIFAVLCEELGFVGAMIVIALFVCLIFRLINLAKKTGTLYSKLIVTGVTSHISIQAILNIAVVTNTIPNTGVSLPFISYGGSSVLCLLAEIGLVLNVTRGIGRNERN